MASLMALCCAAHDAGKSQRLLLVGDEQQVGLQLERLAVEQRQLSRRVAAKRTTMSPSSKASS